MLYIVLTIQTILEFLIIIVSATCVVAIMIFAEEQCENWKRRKGERQLEKEHEEFMQRVHEKELRRKERIKYPLFYWRELIEEKLEDGNF